MDVATLNAKIRAKQLPSYLIFSGDEWKVQQIYIAQIAKVTGLEICRIDSVSDIYGQLKNRSFIKSPYIYIVRDDKELLNNEKLQQQIESGLLGENRLIHLLTSVDKRTKFYKSYSASIIVFERLSDTLLKKYTLKEINLSERNIERLIEVCEHDYGRILLEIDKIKRFDHEMTIGKDNAFEELLKTGTIYQPPYDAIFDLVDAILDRKVNLAFDLLQQAYEVGELTMVMLSVLYNNAKDVLQVQSYEGNNLTQATGLNSWKIHNAKKHLHKYTNSELIYIVQLVQKIESGIKTGRMEEEFAMQYLLTHIM